MDCRGPHGAPPQNLPGFPQVASIPTASRMCLFPSPESLGLTKRQVLKSAKTKFAKHMFAFQSDGWGETEEFKTCLEQCASGETDQGRRSMLAVVSGRGDGKSRLLHELVGLAKKTVDLSRFNTVELRVTFEADTRLRDDELQGDVDVDKILLDRLLFRMLASDGDSFDTFRKEARWGFTSDELVAHIQTMFKGKKKDAMVFLHIDGIHNLDRHCPDLDSEDWHGASILRRLLGVVSLIIKTSPYRFVACSSTEGLPVRKAMKDSTSVLTTEVGPPLLTRIPNEITNKVVLRNKVMFVQMFGMSPRSMEVLVSNKGKTVAEVLREATAAVGFYLMADAVAESTPKRILPTRKVLRSWAPPRWNPVRAPAVQEAWLPRQLPAAVTPRSTVNALLLRRARCAAKLFA